MSIWLLNQLASAVVSAIVSQLYNYVFDNRHMLWEGTVLRWKQNTKLVAEIITAVWQWLTAAVESTKQDCSQLVDLLQIRFQIAWNS